MPVFGTIAARFNDDGVTALYQALRRRLAEHGPGARARARCRRSTCATRPASTPVVPAARVRYLAEIAETVRGYHAHTRRAGASARETASSLREARRAAARGGELATATAVERR